MDKECIKCHKYADKFKGKYCVKCRYIIDKEKN